MPIDANFASYALLSPYVLCSASVSCLLTALASCSICLAVFGFGAISASMAQPARSGIKHTRSESTEPATRLAVAIDCQIDGVDTDGCRDESSA